MAARDKNDFNKVGLKRPESNEQLKAVIGLLTPKKKEGDSKRNATTTVNRELLEQIASRTNQNAIDADSIYQLLPDLTLAEQILVGSILSPRDMSNADTTYSCDDKVFDPDLARPLIGVVENHFKNVYRIDAELETILETALFKEGSYPLLVLPENNLDELINGPIVDASEQFTDRFLSKDNTRGIGFLGAGTLQNDRKSRASLESYGKTYSGDVRGNNNTPIPLITVTDNFNVLKGDAWNRRVKAATIKSILGAEKSRSSVANEAHHGISDEKFESLYRKRYQNKAEEVAVVRPQAYLDRASRGHPLVMKLPSGSVIPIHAPGKPEQQLGFFIMIDQNGRPVTKETSRDYYGELNTAYSNIGSDSNETGSIIRQVRDAMGMKSNLAEKSQVSELTKTFESILENDLVNRLHNGLFNEDLEFDLGQQLSSMLLSRSLSNKKTQLVFIPKELLTYIAFDYRDDGVGRTVLERLKILASMRVSLRFARTMGNLRAAIPRKRVSLSVDENDHDPMVTIEYMKTLVLEAQKQGFPVGCSDPTQIVDALQRQGIDFAINGNGNPAIPNADVTFEDYVTTNEAGNPEFEDQLRREMLMSIGIPPELVDPTSSPDFAVSVVNNNLMMQRYVIRLQRTLMDGVTKFVREFCDHSSILRNQMKEELEAHKDQLTDEQKQMTTDEVVDGFISSIIVSLPSPDSSRTESQIESLQHYSELLDLGLECYITEDIIPEKYRGTHDINRVISVIRSYFLRRYMSKNNILSELDGMTELDDDSKHTFDILGQQEPLVNTIGKAVEAYFKRYEPEETEEETSDADADDVPSDDETVSDDLSQEGDLDLDDGGDDGEGDTTADQESNDESEAVSSDDPEPTDEPSETQDDEGTDSTSQNHWK